MKQGLGTQLRHLIDLLDGDVATAYQEAGLAYRPRYTPVMRALQQHGSATIGQLAEAARITQPAATQTVALMKKDGLVAVAAGEDGRRRVVALTSKGKALLPQLTACWAATARAAASLDADLTFPLSQCLADAIAALEDLPFIARIRDARASSATSTATSTATSSATSSTTSSTTSQSHPRRRPAPKKGESP